MYIYGIKKLKQKTNGTRTRKERRNSCSAVYDDDDVDYDDDYNGDVDKRTLLVETNSSSVMGVRASL